MEMTDLTAGVVLAGGTRYADALTSQGVLAGARRGLVYDASTTVPGTWTDLEAELDRVFALSHAAAGLGVPIVYLVSEPAVWGHADPLTSALATALLGGVRSAAVELARAGVPANAVGVRPDEDPDRVARVVSFLLDGDLTGQVILCGDTHLGRPAA